ncbi:MAG: ATP-binding protein [Oscillospiraceae bacterium]
MTSKIFRSTLTVAAVILLACAVIIMGVMYEYTGNIQRSQLQNELSLAAAGVELEGTGYLEALDSREYRVTWVAADGSVLFDTQADASSMENHADREEIREALQTGRGDSSRYSATLTEKTLYSALRLSDGTVLRLSVSHASILTLVYGMLQPIAVVIVIAIIVSALLARRMARRIVTPLNQLDLDHPLENDTYEELSPLLSRINQQHRQIAAQLRDLQQKKDEFEQITGSMSEGLVLLNEKGVILSINPAAEKLFGADTGCVGQNFLTLDRSHDMSLAISAAMDSGHSEMRGRRGGREYQFDVSRIQSEGQVVGAVLLAFDVTEQELAERSRREFTANVSHELKTPLQSIIGSAELMENGMVRPEDMPRFVVLIRKEASRLVTLIDDIIRLSQLDEGSEMPRETVDLLELAEETAAALESQAEARRVSLCVSGGSACISGVRRLLSEILFNLCDNAVKYNVEGGRVDITVTDSENQAILTVRDTGIGIPEEHQSRVFERFYRVDKSHSKASGGTGLGLSIVKHAVQYHGGSLSLESREGQGTTITVTFPKK